MSGELINFSNYKSKFGTSWRFSNEWTNWNGTVYVAAPSFIIQYKADSVLLRNCTIYVDAYVYRNGKWGLAWSDSAYAKGNNEETKKFYHNKSSEGTSSTDVADCHMWYFNTSCSNAGSTKTYFNVWCGGIGVYTDTEYNNRCKDKIIKYSAGDWWTSYGSPDAFFEAQSPAVYRGDLITDTTGAYICYSEY